MLVKNIGIDFIKYNTYKTFLNSKFNKTSDNFREKPLKIYLNKNRKSKTVFIYSKDQNTINPKLNSIYTYKGNSTINSTTNNDITTITSKNINPKKTYSYFNSRKNKRLQIKSDDIIYNNDKIINIINYSKISSLYNSYNNSNIKKNQISKPKIKIKIIKKIHEFNSVEKYILKADKNIKEIKHEYKPNLNEFYINKELKNYINKSKKMIKAKDDLNQLYRDSHMLNNICDYVSNSLFKMKVKKRNYIKNINKELYIKKLENLHKKMLNLKILNEQIPDEKLFMKKKFGTTDSLEINPKLKAQLIYKSCYPYNSIKTMFDRFKHKKNLNQVDEK